MRFCVKRDKKNGAGAADLRQKGNETMKCNNLNGAGQKRMERNGWHMQLPLNCSETPDEIYDRLVKAGYRQVKVYWCGTQIRGIHSYFAFVKR